MNEPMIIEDIADLLTQLRDTDQQPVVIVSARRGERRYGLSPRRLAADLSGRAVIAQLAGPDVSWALGEARPDLATYGGAVRVVGADGYTKVIRTDGDSDQCQRQIHNTVHLARGSLGSSRTANTDTGTCTRAVATIDRPAGTDRAATASTAPAAPEGGGRAAAVTGDSTDDRGRRVPLTNGPALFGDRQTQMRYDIGQMWLYRVPEPERRQWSLRPFRLSSSFLDSTTSTELASRERIVEVAVDVVTRRAFEMASRAVHPYGSGHASAPPITRADGATAYRATIRHSAGGPRLLWWECCDGSVDLAWVGHHDDPMPTPQRRTP